MRYFSYMAEKSFMTSSNGERLYYCGTPWSTPYVIPDSVTEQILFKKQLWMMRIFMGSAIFGLSIPLFLRPEGLGPYWILEFFIILSLAYWIVEKAVFAGVLKNLKRTNAKPSFKSQFTQMAKKLTKSQLMLRVLSSLILVLVGVLMIVSGHYMAMAVGIAFVILFGLFALGWGSALRTKTKLETGNLKK